MALRLHRNRPALYRSVRDGDRVRSVYVASGPAAVAMAERDAQAKREAKARRFEDEARERIFAEWFASVEMKTREVLIGSGYHQHKGSEWRKRRGPTA